MHDWVDIANLSTIPFSSSSKLCSLPCITKFHPCIPDRPPTAGAADQPGGRGDRRGGRADRCGTHNSAGGQGLFNPFVSHSILFNRRVDIEKPTLHATVSMRNGVGLFWRINLFSCFFHLGFLAYLHIFSNIDVSNFKIILDLLSMYIGCDLRMFPNFTHDNGRSSE